MAVREVRQSGAAPRLTRLWLRTAVSCPFKPRTVIVVITDPAQVLKILRPLIKKGTPPPGLDPRCPERGPCARPRGGRSVSPPTTHEANLGVRLHDDPDVARPPRSIPIATPLPYRLRHRAPLACPPMAGARPSSLAADQREAAAVVIIRSWQGRPPRKRWDGNAPSSSAPSPS